MEWMNLQKVMFEYTEFVEEAIKSKMPSYYQLKDNISFFLTISHSVFEISFQAESYWKYANYGRGPGKFPPFDAISKWITRRRITPYPTKSGSLPTHNQLTYLISRKIAREGFKGSGFLESGLAEQEAYWEDRISTAITDDIEEGLDDWMSPLEGDSVI